VDLARGSAKARLGLALLLGFFFLSGCGWQPLYGRAGASTDGNAGPELSQVHIQPIANRVGQNLYNMLRDRMNPEGPPAEPKYDLAVDLTQSAVRELIQPNQTTTRSAVTFFANFQLYEHGKKEPVFKGQARATTTYDVLNDPYASVISANDASKRGAQSLADEISNRLAVFLSAPDGGG
jgi:LPS-assembly lipoprotein